jgi:DNA primase
MSLTPAFLDELRSRISLSGVIGRTTRVIKAGREFKACCPFHNEKTPSFTINDEKGFYHCFGCGAHGDVIRWMTDQRGLAFMDAVKELAAEAGLEVPAPDRQAMHKAEAVAGLHDVMAAAQEWFVAQLAGPDGVRARAYLATRGFAPEIVTQFGFGYAPEGRQALKAALSRFPEDLLVEAGLRIRVEDEAARREPYDRFRGRLMLPIHDARGRVIAFGGRILDSAKTDAPKYLNSPDTPLFDKGRTLYNLHRAGPLARQGRRLVVVEGYMDAIALANAGIGECVAPLGTALTERQIEMAWRLVETPVLCFDGDAAGTRAAMRAAVRALPLLRPSHSLRIVRLPAGLDPDDLIRREGVETLRALLSAPISLVDLLWEHERDAVPLETPEDKAGLKARLLGHVETIADEDIRALYRKDLLDRFSAFAFPRREYSPPPPRQSGFARPGSGKGRWQRGEPPPPPHPLPETALHARNPGGRRREALLAAICAGLALRPGLVARHGEGLAQLAQADSRIDALLDVYERGETLESADFATIWAKRGLHPPSPDDYSRIRYAFLVDDAEEAAAEAAMALAITVLVEEPRLDAAIEQATARFDIEEQQRLLKRKLEFDARLRQTAGMQPPDRVGSPGPEHD